MDDMNSDSCRPVLLTTSTTVSTTTNTHSNDDDSSRTPLLFSRNNNNENESHHHDAEENDDCNYDGQANNRRPMVPVDTIATTTDVMTEQHRNTSHISHNDEYLNTRWNICPTFSRGRSNSSTSRSRKNSCSTFIRILFPWLFSSIVIDPTEAVLSLPPQTRIISDTSGVTTRQSPHQRFHGSFCNYFHNVPYENDSVVAIIIGVATLVLIGIIVGILSHYASSSIKENDIISSCIGYIYVIMWSVSFYPQCIMNYQRQTCTGLSIDFCWYNFIGFICYTTYNVSLYYNPKIQHQYYQRHHSSSSNDSSTTSSSTIPIQSNDVAFAVHALLLCSILLFQVGYYDGLSALQPSRQSRYILMIILSGMVLYPIIFLWLVPMITITTSQLTYEVLDYIYFLSYIKVCITCMKYIPQVYSNYSRRSTAGWNIWQILLDFFGGLFSTAQLLYDASSTTAVVFNNVPKFMLGNISILFDIIFMVQHYYLYPLSVTTSMRDEPSSLSRSSLDEHRHHLLPNYSLRSSIEAVRDTDA